MSASGGVVRDDKQKPDHDGGVEAASVAGLFHCSIFKISLYLASICSSFSKTLSSTSAVICRRWPDLNLRVAPSPLDHENRKAPISKPAANAQRPNVQAETTRTKLRRSCGISWDRSVIAAVPPEQHLLGPSFMDGAASRPPGRALNPNSGHRLSGFRHGRFWMA
jgi:hypothetical protein